MFGIGTKTFMFAAWNYSNQAHNNMIHISNIHYNHMVNANCPSPITKVQKERLYRKNKQNTIALNARKNFFLFALDSSRMQTAKSAWDFGNTNRCHN